jgi:alpha-beta hydrolase superfamily lysophospholipase
MTNTIPVTFQSDGLTLKGVLHLPDVDKPPLVVGCHGLLSTGDSPKQIALADRCNEAGIAYFRFDHRGCGASQGVFETDTSLQARCNDLLSALQTIQAMDMTTEKIGVFGSSMGGAVCLAFASVHPVASLVTFAALYQSSGIIDQQQMNLRFDLRENLSKLHHILIFHGDRDEVVPVSQAKTIYEQARFPKKLILQKGGDHRMSDGAHQDAFVHDAVRWYVESFEL